MVNRKTRILIVDDHTMFLDGITEIIKNTSLYDVVETASCGDDALEIISNTTIDLVITDLRMKNMDGNELSKVLKTKYPNIKILVVSMHNDHSLINQLLENGVSGYILKNTGKQELLAAIHDINCGKTYFGEEVKSNFINSKVVGLNSSDENIPLTKREKEVLNLIALEHTTNEMAEKLFISLNTVETHRKNILKKFKVRNSIGIVKRAIELGLLNS
jgi:two-component system, NarL family, nitrate/nitrite response regulator NarL